MSNPEFKDVPDVIEAEGERADRDFATPKGAEIQMGGNSDDRAYGEDSGNEVGGMLARGELSVVTSRHFGLGMGAKSREYLNTAQEPWHHAKLYQDWAASKGVTSLNWHQHVEEHDGDLKSALADSAWKKLPTADKVDWQNTEVGKSVTGAYAKQLRAQKQNQPSEVTDRSDRNARYTRMMQLRNLALGGNQAYSATKGLDEKAQAGLKSLEEGAIPRNRRIEDVPDFMDPRQRHAIGETDTRPSIALGKQIQPEIAEHFGSSPDFSHHVGLANDLMSLVSEHHGVDNATARKLVGQASPTTGFSADAPMMSGPAGERGVRQAVVPLSSRVSHHANKAMQYLTASAKAQSLGYKDIAMEHFANATQHAQMADKAVKGRSTSVATSGLGGFLARQSGEAPAGPDVSRHLTAYRALMGAR